MGASNGFEYNRHFSLFTKYFWYLLSALNISQVRASTLLCPCLRNTAKRHNGKDPNQADVDNQANFGMPHVTISVDLTAPLAAATEMEVPSFESAGRDLKFTNSILERHFCWPG